MAANEKKIKPVHVVSACNETRDMDKSLQFVWGLKHQGILKENSQ